MLTIQKLHILVWTTNFKIIFLKKNIMDLIRIIRRPYHHFSVILDVLAKLLGGSNSSHKLIVLHIAHVSPTIIYHILGCIFDIIYFEML